MAKSDTDVIDPKVQKAYQHEAKKLGKGVEISLELGVSFQKIRDDKLFVAVGCKSFSEWVDSQNCQYEKSHAYRLIETAETMQRILASGVDCPPSLLSIRGLTQLKKIDEKILPRTIKKIARLSNPSSEKINEIATAARNESKKAKAKAAAKDSADLKEAYRDDEGVEVPKELWRVWRRINDQLKLVEQIRKLSGKVAELANDIDSVPAAEISNAMDTLAEDLLGCGPDAC